LTGLSHTPVKIGLSKDQIEYIARGSNYTYEEVLDIIRAILTDTLNGVTADIEQWIDKAVPKRTGQLRDNLKANLKSSNVQKGLLRIILRTHVDYASDVNQMSTSQVRHHGEVGYAYYYGHYGKIILSDPSAEGNFFDKMITFARERIAVNLVQAKNNNLGTGKGKLGTMGKIKGAI